MGFRHATAAALRFGPSRARPRLLRGAAAPGAEAMAAGNVTAMTPHPFVYNYQHLGQLPLQWWLLERIWLRESCVTTRPVLAHRLRARAPHMR